MLTCQLLNPYWRISWYMTCSRRCASWLAPQFLLFLQFSWIFDRLILPAYRSSLFTGYSDTTSIIVYMPPAVDDGPLRGIKVLKSRYSGHYFVSASCCFHVSRVVRNRFELRQLVTRYEGALTLLFHSLALLSQFVETQLLLSSHDVKLFNWRQQL